VRTTVEEFNLSANLHDHDEMHARFIRTYRNVYFPGQQFLQRLEVEERAGKDGKARTLLPKVAKLRKGDVALSRPWADLYGFRPLLPSLRHLSPWEFTQWWEVSPLHPPLERDHVPSEKRLTDWTDAGSAAYR
jgi:hypothetical protein